MNTNNKDYTWSLIVLWLSSSIGNTWWVTFTVKPDVALEFCFRANNKVHHIFGLLVSNL